MQEIIRNIFSSKQVVVNRNRILLIISIFIIISMGRTTLNLLKKGDIIEDAKKKVEKLEKEQEELLKLLGQAESEHFIEQQARDKLGLAKEGEVVVVLPPEEVLRSLAPPPEKDEFFIESLPIWKRWTKMFFKPNI